MSIAFSVNLIALRQRKGVSQKVAAEELGITPALLSHYENGIRECKLDMLVKLADYYGVTTDYITGHSESLLGAGEMFSTDIQPGDAEISAKTIMRSVIDLSRLAENSDAGTEKFFCDYFSLCLKKYVDALEGNSDVRSKFTTQVLDMATSECEKADNVEEGLSLCTQTVLSNADFVIDTALSGLMGRK